MAKPEGRIPLGRPMCRQQDKSKWLSRIRLGNHRLVFSGSGKGQVEYFCEHGNGTFRFHRMWGILV